MFFNSEPNALPAIEEIKMITEEAYIIRTEKEKILNEKWMDKAIGEIAKQITKAAKAGEYSVSVKLYCPNYAKPEMLAKKIEVAGYKADYRPSYEYDKITFYVYWK